MADVALVPEGDIFHRGKRVTANHARQSTDALAFFGVALVGHGRGALLLSAKRLEHLADFSTLEMPDFLSHLFQRTGNKGKCGEQVGMAVTLNNLAGDRINSQP